MNGKKLILLVGALVIAVVTAIMAKNMFSGSGANQAQAAPVVPAGPEVLIARKPLPVGTIIEADDLVFQAWPKELLDGTYYTEDEEDSDPTALYGTVVRTAIAAGQPITRGSLVGPEDRGFLAAALGPGMRAVTIPVSNTSGVAGFIFPGDRVDLVLTQEVSGDGPSLKASETIVRNLRVLATDQRITDKNEDGQVEVKTFSTVTVEATPKIAEKVAVAQTIGQLSLSLRALVDNTAELERAIASGEVEVPEDATPGEERKLLLAVANKPIDTDITYTTGGQVSRFQRSSIPSQGSGGSSNAQPSAPAAPAGGYVSAGPSVRVARGNAVTVVPVGAR
ncbi:Flp pilus assembly protein CpaB [Sphingomicrobium clamense]|uniref:Flp pilus assembly protein CpaB n=1 Tax=Sphingomicrobium clamense TaxID=2851013 RepID=A0ABS6V5I6_9SPHN|nr:Flp pilus assembly protein CpaB [Sphingomicrobium sp. B8]MBW0144831.1 Flp pilus assembly protein CpaB [Sphingomicrobium sp. B8]